MLNHHLCTPVPYTAIFEFVYPFDHMMMSLKFRDDISHGSGVIALTHKQRNTQTHGTENNTTLAVQVVKTEY